VPLAEFETIDVLWIVLSVFLVVVGLTLGFLLLRLSGTARRLTLLLQGIESSVIPLVSRVQGTVDRVNTQLDKADVVTTSLVDGADAADTAVRAVSMAITRPVTLISGAAKGVSTGVSAFFSGAGLGEAVDAGREARVRRERELADELASARAQAPGGVSAPAPAASAPSPEPSPGPEPDESTPTTT
jgi:hypothetical protein